MRIFVIEVCRVLVVELTPFSSLNFHSLHLGALTGGILFFGDFIKQLLILEILFHRNLLGLQTNINVYMNIHSYSDHKSLAYIVVMGVYSQWA